VAGVDLAAVDRATLSGYIGRDVVEVGPLAGDGPEATSFIGERIQKGLRERDPDHQRQPGEMVPARSRA